MEDSSTKTTPKKLPISTLVHRITSNTTNNKPKISKTKPTISLNSRSKKNHKSTQKKKKTNVHDDDDDDDIEMDGDDEKEEVERKIEALQRIVPGGERLGVDKLFEETAEYIMALQWQLKAMRTLASLFQALHKDKANFGG